MSGPSGASRGSAMVEGIDDDLSSLLTRLVDGQRRALGGSLLGSFLFGSVVSGDFEPGVSDVDTAAVLRSDPTRMQLDALARMHEEVVDAMPHWDDRVEAVYLSAGALSRFRSGSLPAARISPREPFHAIEVDDRWLIDWHQLRSVGVPLIGPSAASLVPPISRLEWRQAVRRHLLEWPDDPTTLETRDGRSYAILSMCRGLRAWRTGEQVSKREAARWASHVLPEHAVFIEGAMAWRLRHRDPAAFDGTGRSPAPEASSRM